jgi:hypothetical protein
MTLDLEEHRGVWQIPRKRWFWRFLRYLPTWR